MTAPDTAPVLLGPAAWAKLLNAHTAYFTEAGPSYDEVLFEVAARVGTSGSIGKADIGALLFWKRLRADTRWVRHIMNLPDHQVRNETRTAVEAANDPDLSTPDAAAAGRLALSSLPGFKSGDALASALLLAAAPDRMAVYDTRAQKGLKELDLELTAARGRYGRYMGIVEGLKATALHYGQTWTARDVDLGLYSLGGRKSS
ncbi:hypothetical protein [Arthrobacter sp. A2-55]|uniref:hypothetical protein n=1 Tax=Arthrobacter sp. A2-55 TaxID=2897337 RepID=UPI0021CDD630|nr:hypothetical protein [Arthrobacter sp. A2-55]MCU6481942.1 hypothetical protein [Arthrobacter sp. A2-55]